MGITVVNFRDSNILDTALVEAMARELYALVDQQAQRRIILDFHLVRALSSQMIGTMISLHKRLEKIKGKMVLCGVHEDIYRIFTITRLDSTFVFAKDEQQALAQFGAAGNH